MADPASRVSRVRAGAGHKSTLATAWRVKVTGIEFIKDVYLSENGYNLSDKAPDLINYPQIKENFYGWGRGPYLTGWDWQGSDNLERAACYIRLKPIVMKVRLRSSQPAPSARTFVLVVDPILSDDATLLTSGSKSVDWPREAQIKLGADYYDAKGVMSIQRVFHRSRVTRFPAVEAKGSNSKSPLKGPNQCDVRLPTSDP